MKKVLAIVMAVVLIAAVFAACSAQPEESAEAPASSSGDQIVFANLNGTRSDVWNNCSLDAFQWCADQVGVKVIEYENEFNTETQTNNMDLAVNEGVDGINLFTITPELDVDLSKVAEKAGIPLVIENSNPEEGCVCESVAAYDYEELGYQCALFMADVWKGKKVFLCLGALGMNLVEPWEEGFARGMEETGNCFEVVGKQYTDWATEKSMNVTQDFIQSGVEFDALFAHNGQMYAGCMAALEDANLLDKVETMTEGGNPDELQWIKEGKHEYALSIPPNLQGIACFKALWMKVNGDTPPAQFELPATRVSKDNLDTAPSWENNEIALEMLGGLGDY